MLSAAARKRSFAATDFAVPLDDLLLQQRLGFVQRGFGLPLLRDVGIGRDHPAGRQRNPADLDHGPVGPHALEMVRLEAALPLHPLAHVGFHIAGAVLSARRIEAKRLLHIEAEPEAVSGQVEQLDESAG